MTPSLLRTVLLAVASIGIAQTRHVPATELAKHEVTSSLSTRVACGVGIHNCNNHTNLADEGANAVSAQQQAALEHPSQKQFSLEDDGNGDAFTVYIRSPKSVVQDWSLVCQQLCGAGLGGTPCASYCHSSEEPSLLPAFTANKQKICEDLCRLQLGDGSCNCSADEAPPSVPQSTFQCKWRNVVCSSFCEHSGTTLTGCSICMDGKRQMAMRSSVEISTPDWTKLCADLCKTGDGGSLCNCDLTPFF